MTRIKYQDCTKIKTSKSTVWLIEFQCGRKELSIWHRKAKIENIVESIKIQHPGEKFTVLNIDVGQFQVTLFDKHHHYLSNDGRKLNQNLRLILPGDKKYDFGNIKQTKIKRRTKYKDIPY